jgi:hypothetical protein
MLGEFWCIIGLISHLHGPHSYESRCDFRRSSPALQGGFERTGRTQFAAADPPPLALRRAAELVVSWLALHSLARSPDRKFYRLSSFPSCLRIRPRLYFSGGYQQMEVQKDVTY